MADPLKPDVTVLCKLGSLAVHVDEMLSDDGHALDRTEIETLLKDEDVKEWLAEMDKMALVPKRRRGH